MNHKKLFFVLYFLFFYIIMYSQNGISFTELNLANDNLSKEFKKYQILKINDNTQLLTDGAEFQINYLNKYSFELKENRFIVSR